MKKDDEIIRVFGVRDITFSRSDQKYEDFETCGLGGEVDDDEGPASDEALPDSVIDV